MGQTWNPAALQAIMDERALTIEQLAASLWINERTVRRWLTGAYAPRRNMALRLAAFLKIDWRTLYQTEDVAA